MIKCITIIHITHLICKDKKILAIKTEADKKIEGDVFVEATAEGAKEGYFFDESKGDYNTLVVKPAQDAAADKYFEISESAKFLWVKNIWVKDSPLAHPVSDYNAFKAEQKYDIGEENYKILKRENDRLKLSLQDGIRNYGDDKEIISFIHYPPFYKEVEIPDEINFAKTLRDYNVRRCYYAHLHGDSHKEAIEGVINDIEYKLVSSDYLNFELLKII